VTFELPDALQDMRRHVRAFARERIAPLAAEVDAQPRFPRETLAEMGPMGLMGVGAPERSGGAGLDTLAYAVLLEEMAAADAAHATLMAVTNGQPKKMLLSYGSEAQKEAYLPRLATSEAFGRPIRAFQAVGSSLADMATRIEASRLLTWKAAWAMDGGFRVTLQASMAELFASETAGLVTDAALQVLDEAGHTRDHPVERYLRDARVTRIYEGTSEIQRMVIARQIYRDREQGGTS